MSVPWKEWAIRLAFTIAGAVVEALSQILRTVVGT